MNATVLESAIKIGLPVWIRSVVREDSNDSFSVAAVRLAEQPCRC